MSDENFEGHPDRECGEHRTTGHRAWCFEDHEWCYPTIPCRGCELPMLRSALLKIEGMAIAHGVKDIERVAHDALDDHEEPETFLENLEPGM